MDYKYIKLSELIKKNDIKITHVGKIQKVKTVKIKCADCNFQCNLTPRESSHPDDSSLTPKTKPKKPKHKTKNRVKVVNKDKRNNFNYR